MTQWQFPVIDCDGHLLESITELADFMKPGARAGVLNRSRDREGVFPSLDGFHGPRIPGNGAVEGREYVGASSQRRGSGEDCLAFLDQAGVEQGVIFTSEGLSVGFIQSEDYAVDLCRAYNDYIHDRYRRLSDRMHPMALIPFQDPEAAAQELRRAVRELGLPGAMVPSSGLPLHVGHDFYRPIYAEAANLECVLGIHGGSVRGFGLDTFSKRGVPGLHHSIPLMLAMSSLIYHGVLERFPNLRVGFFEGGCAWVVSILDRVERGEEVTGRMGPRPLPEYLASGRILIGCEGNDGSLPYLASRGGVDAFAWASDYPHEVDLEAAKHMIAETVDHRELSQEQKAAVLGENARRFFRLPTLKHAGDGPPAQAGAASRGA